MDQKSDNESNPEWYAPQWFISVGGRSGEAIERRGPFSLEQIQDFLRRDQIKPHFKMGKETDRELSHTVLEILQPYLNPTDTLLEALQAARNRRSTDTRGGGIPGPALSVQNRAHNRSQHPVSSRREEAQAPPFLQKVIFFIGALFLFLFAIVASVCVVRLLLPRDSAEEKIEAVAPPAVTPPPRAVVLPTTPPPPRKETSPSQLRGRESPAQREAARREPEPREVREMPAAPPLPNIPPPGQPVSPHRRPADAAGFPSGPDVHPEDVLEIPGAMAESIPLPPDLNAPVEEGPVGGTGAAPGAIVPHPLDEAPVEVNPTGGGG